MSSSGTRSIRARATVSPPKPLSKTPIGRSSTISPRNQRLLGELEGAAGARQSRIALRRSPLRLLAIVGAFGARCGHQQDAEASEVDDPLGALGDLVDR